MPPLPTCPTLNSARKIYGRLVTHAKTKLPDGSYAYDYTKFEPELAERWDIAPDNSTVTFYLRKDATFHDGSKVTANDVKWSLERAIAAGGFPAIQMGASMMKTADQFVVVDDYTIKVNFPTPNKLVLPNLAVPVAQIVNSGTRKETPTAADPWALDWVGKNDARRRRLPALESWKPGAKSLSLASRTGSQGRSPAWTASSYGRYPPQAHAAHCLRRATPTSRSICRPRTFPSWSPPAS
jgi:peptide/nickel transport system substrate-binding protein